MNITCQGPTCDGQFTITKELPSMGVLEPPFDTFTTAYFKKGVPDGWSVILHCGTLVVWCDVCVRWYNESM